MPRLSVWMIRAALIYLGVGFTFGGLLLIHKGVPLSAWLWRTLPAHIEFLLVGWTLQLVMGVGYWILPRFRHPPRRGDVRLAILAVFSLNAGVLVAGLAPLFALPSGWIFWGRLLELGGALAFAVHAWPRVKAAGAP